MCVMIGFLPVWCHILFDLEFVDDDTNAIGAQCGGQ